MKKSILACQLIVLLSVLSLLHGCEDASAAQTSQAQIRLNHLVKLSDMWVVDIVIDTPDNARVIIIDHLGKRTRDAMRITKQGHLTIVADVIKSSELKTDLFRWGLCLTENDNQVAAVIQTSVDKHTSLRKLMTLHIMDQTLAFDKPIDLIEIDGKMYQLKITH